MARADQVAGLVTAAEAAVPGVTDEAGAWSTLQAHLATLAPGGPDPIAATHDGPHLSL